MMSKSALASLLFALVLPPQAAAVQTLPQSKPGPSATAVPLQQAMNPASYVIGPQDQLTITVIDETDISGKYRVDEGGGITFPYVGRVTAAGMTVGDFQER